MSHINNSILEAIGDAPIVKVNNVGPKDVELEAFNLMGSIKDRLHSALSRRLSVMVR